MRFSKVVLFGSLAFGSPIFSKESNGAGALFVNEEEPYWRTLKSSTYPQIENCNATQVKQINKYYHDLIEVSSVARDNLLLNGADDQSFKNWFGEGNPLTVLGLIENVLTGNKDGIIYRCDDIDGDCQAHPQEWPGYHRSGDSAQETVLCDLFFNSKHPIERICTDGNILDIKPKRYAGIDLFHRFLHLGSMNKGFFGEYVEELEELLQYAQNNATYAVLNTDNILYYLAETYSINLTGSGCLGSLPKLNITN